MQPLYYEDYYIKDTEARIIARKDGLVLLDKTPLYPGGGGQPPDEGIARCNDRTINIKHIGEGWHRIDGECNAERIFIEVNWEKRYHMMKAHTAEHAFFRFLQMRGARLVKIALDNISTIVFTGEIKTEDVLWAEEKTREIIKEGREVNARWIKREDARNYPLLRINWERIKDDIIRIVEIEGHDISACKGTHVKNLREIGDFAVIKFRGGSKRKEIKFVIGALAEKIHYGYSKEIRSIAWTSGLEIEKVSSYVKNLAEENKKLHQALKDISKHIPFQEVMCNELVLAIVSVYGGDRKILIKRMLEWTKLNKGIAIYVNLYDKSIAMAFSENFQDYYQVALDLLKEMGGKGGGKNNFISGGIENPEYFVENLKKILCSQDIHLHGGENET